MKTQNWQRHDARLRRYARGANVRRWLVALAGIGGVVCLLLGLVHLTFWLYPWVFLPYVFDFLVGAGVIAVLVATIRVFWVAPLSAADCARALDQLKLSSHPLQAIAHELGRSPSQQQSELLVAEVLRRAQEEAKLLPRALPGLMRPKALVPSALGGLFFAAALAAHFPGILQYWQYPLYALRPAGAALSPGSVAVAAGQKVTVSLTPLVASGQVARFTSETVAGGAARSVLLQSDKDGVFRRELGPLSQSVVYRFGLGNREFGPETLQVVWPPVLNGLSVTVVPPAYTRLAPQVLTAGQGSAAVLAGSTARFSLSASYALQEALLVTGQGDSVSLACTGSKAEGELLVAQSLTYRFELQDTLGQRSDSLGAYFMQVVADEDPLVQIVYPGENRLLRPEQVETLWVEGTDDLGVRRMGVGWFTNTLDSVRNMALKVNAPGPFVRSTLEWNLVNARLYPGDTVYYWAWAQDGRPGGRRVPSDTFWFRLPGFAERHEMMARSGEYARSTMEDVVREQKELQQTLEETVRRSQGSNELSWEQKQVLTDVQRQIDAQRDSLTQAVEALAEMVEQLKDQGLESDEILAKMDEVRKAIEELVEQYGDSLLTKKDEKQSEVSFDDMQEAVEKMKELLPNLQERLESALKYLETLRKDQQRLSLALQMENLAREQQRVQREQQAGVQQKAQQQLQNATRELSQKIRDATGSDEDDLFDKDAIPALDRVDETAEQLGEQMQQGGMPPQQMQNKQSANMMAAAGQMRSAMSNAQMARMLQEQQRLMELADDALTLSDWQSQNRDKSRSAAREQTAQMQQALMEALQSTRSKLDSMGMVAPRTLGQIVEQLDQAAQAMAQAQRSLESGAVAGPMTRASGALNAAAQAMLGAASGMMMSGQGGQGGQGQDGLSGMMRSLAGKQGQINAATSELLRQMLGGKKPGGAQGGGEGEAVAQAQAQARKAQQALAEQLGKLAQQYGNADGNLAGGEKRLKELEQEARRLAKMLENPTGDLRERQDRFLARMLQSTLSVHREGEGKQKRESHTSQQNFSQQAPFRPRLGFDQLDSFEQMRLRALGGNYPPEYRIAVKAYFDSLGVLFLRDR